MTRKKAMVTTAPLELRWRWHNGNITIRRVWRRDWIGDQFELISPVEFQTLERMCNKFAIRLVDMNNSPEDND